MGDEKITRVLILDEDSGQVWRPGTISHTCSRKQCVTPISCESDNSPKQDHVSVYLEDTKEERLVPTSSVVEANTIEEDDMTNLCHIHEGGILENLEKRSYKDLPYTFLGGVLVIVNPLKQVSEPHSMCGSSEVIDSPHPYSLAEVSHQRLQLERIDQCIIISGESGSGKSEACKRVIRHWVYKMNRKCKSVKDSKPFLNDIKKQASVTKVNRDTTHRFSLEIPKLLSTQDLQIKTIKHSHSTSDNTDVKKNYGFVRKLQSNGSYVNVPLRVGTKTSGNVLSADEKLVKVSPILEAFGNAVTVANHNSSRFGKFVKLCFSTNADTSELVFRGAFIETYLLERSRVAFHDGKEKNFHIFYQMLAGADDATLQKFGFEGKRDPCHHVYLRPGNRNSNSRQSHSKKNGTENIARLCRSNSSKFRRHKVRDSTGKIEGKRILLTHKSDNATEKFTSNNQNTCVLKSNEKPSIKKHDKTNLVDQFREVRDALFELKSAKEHVDDVFQIVAAIIHLGNIQFENEDSIEGHVAKVLTSTEQSVEKAAFLFGMEKENLLRIICQKQLRLRGETLVSKRNAENANRSRDAISRSIYHRLFNWIVCEINANLSPDAELLKKKKDFSFLGVLDIFGFESLDRNSFEQLLINFANEALQATFNTQLFQAELSLYREEGFILDELDNIKPTNGSEMCLDLLGPIKPGINPIKKTKQISLLETINAQSTVPEPSDEKLLHNFEKAFSKHSCYSRTHAKFSKYCFTIKHFAGDVMYDVEGFIDKNIDSMPCKESELYGNSNFGFMVELGSIQYSTVSENEKRKSVRTKSSTAGKFKGQIKALVDTLDSSQCSFIRCLKPNPHSTRIIGSKDNSNSWYNRKFVIRQLRCLNIPATAQMLQRGLPARLPYSSVLEKFNKLKGNDYFKFLINDQRYHPSAKVAALLHALQIPQTQFRLGATKVFFTNGTLAILNKVLDEDVSKEVTERIAQAISWTDFYRIVSSYILISRQQEFKAFTKMARLRNHSITIQKNARRYIARKKYVIEQRACIVIQNSWRTYVQKRLLSSMLLFWKDIQKKIIRLQSNIRRRKAKLVAHRRMNSIILLQHTFRRWIVLIRKAFRKRQSIRLLQRVFRDVITAKKREEDRYIASILIQRRLRAWMALKQQTRKMNFAAIVIQRTYRIFLERQHQKHIEYLAAVTLQRIMRGYVAKNNHVKIMKAVCIIQVKFRRHIMKSNQEYKQEVVHEESITRVHSDGNLTLHDSDSESMVDETDVCYNDVDDGLEMGERSESKYASSDGPRGRNKVEDIPDNDVETILGFSEDESSLPDNTSESDIVNSFLDNNSTQTIDIYIETLPVDADTACTPRQKLQSDDVKGDVAYDHPTCPFDTEEVYIENGTPKISQNTNVEASLFAMESNIDGSIDQKQIDNKCILSNKEQNQTGESNSKILNNNEIGQIGTEESLIDSSLKSCTPIGSLQINEYEEEKCDENSPVMTHTHENAKEPQDDYDLATIFQNENSQMTEACTINTVKEEVDLTAVTALSNISENMEEVSVETDIGCRGTDDKIEANDKSNLQCEGAERTVHVENAGSLPESPIQIEDKVSTNPSSPLRGVEEVADDMDFSQNSSEIPIETLLPSESLNETSDDTKAKNTFAEEKCDIRSPKIHPKTKPIKTNEEDILRSIPRSSELGTNFTASDEVKEAIEEKAFVAKTIAQTSTINETSLAKQSSVTNMRNLNCKRSRFSVDLELTKLLTQLTAKGEPLNESTVTTVPGQTGCMPFTLFPSKKGKIIHKIRKALRRETPYVKQLIDLILQARELGLNVNSCVELKQAEVILERYRNTQAHTLLREAIEAEDIHMLEEAIMSTYCLGAHIVQQENLEKAERLKARLRRSMRLSSRLSQNVDLNSIAAQAV